MTPAERAAGLTQPLPPAEHILWQGKPDRRQMTRDTFRFRWLAGYFAAAALLLFVTALRAGRPAGQGVAEMVLLLPVAALAFGILSLMGAAMARASSYTLTNRRLILHIGVAMEMTVSVPLSAVSGASLRRGRAGCGDIALAAKDLGGINVVALWPHTRAWHVFEPQPMLRAVPDVERVAELIGDALTAFNAGGRVRTAAIAAAPPEPAPARQAVPA